MKQNVHIVLQCIFFFTDFILHVKKSLFCCFECILTNHNLHKQSSIGGHLGRVHLNENVIMNYYVFMSVPMLMSITIHVCPYVHIIIEYA